MKLYRIITSAKGITSKDQVELFKIQLSKYCDNKFFVRQTTFVANVLQFDTFTLDSILELLFDGRIESALLVIYNVSDLTTLAGLVFKIRDELIDLPKFRLYALKTQTRHLYRTIVEVDGTPDFISAFDKQIFAANARQTLLEIYNDMNPIITNSTGLRKMFGFMADRKIKSFHGDYVKCGRTPTEIIKRAYDRYFKDGVTGTMCYHVDDHDAVVGCQLYNMTCSDGKTAKKNSNGRCFIKTSGLEGSLPVDCTDSGNRLLCSENFNTLIKKTESPLFTNDDETLNSPSLYDLYTYTCVLPTLFEVLCEMAGPDMPQIAKYVSNIHSPDLDSTPPDSFDRTPTDGKKSDTNPIDGTNTDVPKTDNIPRDEHKSKTPTTNSKTQASDHSGKHTHSHTRNCTIVLACVSISALVAFGIYKHYKNGKIG